MFNRKLRKAVHHLIEIARRESFVRRNRDAAIRSRLASVEFTVLKLWEILIMIQPEVQTLLDSSAEMKTLLTALVEQQHAHVSDLMVRLAAPVAAIDEENLAALRQVGADLADSVAAAKVALTPPVPPTEGTSS